MGTGDEPPSGTIPRPERSSVDVSHERPLGDMVGYALRMPLSGVDQPQRVPQPGRSAQAIREPLHLAH